MPRRRGTNKTSAHSAPAGRNRCRQIVLVDSRPLREQARRDYEKTRADLTKAQAQLDRFENHDRPQFQRWLSSHFGPLMTEVRELRAKLIEAEELAFAVEAESLLTGCSYQRAYQRVTRRDTQTDEPDPTSSRGSHRQRRRASSESDDQEEFFRQYFQQHTRPKSDSSDAPTPARLKELYRALVRLLHPDKNKHLTAQQREWWHQAQAAYQERDEAQLELILTLCELEQPDHDIRHTTLSLLQRIVDRLKSSLRELRRKLRASREDPAWGFSTKRNHELLHHQLQRQLEEEIYNLRETYQVSQELLKAWKRKSPPRPRSKPEWW